MDVDAFSFPGFNLLEEVYHTSRSVAFRASRESDNVRVILKTVPAALVSAATKARLHKEYEVTKELQESPYIARAFDLVEHGGRTALVLEDVGATSLEAYAGGRKLSVSDALRVGVSVAAGLEHLHKAGLIHKQVQPSNVLVADQLAVVKLADLSISSWILEENRMLMPPDVLKATAAYISPEQTGRVSRSVDFRADLYSLGVVLYEALTGQRPFRAEELQPLLYQHIAVVPTAPASLDPTIPIVVSDIVVKLLAKDAAGRYQTAAGLRTDLQTCLTQLGRGRLQPFPLGTADHVGRLRPPDRVVGRESEVASLLSALVGVSARKTLGVALITGYSGIGKTALVGELQHAWPGRKLAVVQGKFDQYSRSTPFKAISMAVQSLLQSVLGEPSATIWRWRDQLQASVGKNGRLLTDVLPALGHLLGEQPEVPHMDATSAEARFLETFVRLLRCCAQLRSPLVLFLDDLQWTDTPSLRLLDALFRDNKGLPLLLIGAYRDAEIDGRHALTRLIGSLEEQETVPLLQLRLGPLPLPATQALVAACVGGDVASVADLASVVHEKTEGNPFYELQFLTALERDGMLHFDKDTGEGRWGNLARLRETLPVTMNVVEFMANQLRARLPTATRVVLNIAAILGDSFSLTMLMLACQKPAKEVMTKLWPALTAGFLCPLGNSYRENLDQQPAALDAVRFRFRHDRIREAAYQELPSAERSPVHLRVGRRLLEGLSCAQYEEHSFAVLHHFNQALPLITDPAERRKLAQANLAAGRKARAAVAYEAALQHVRHAQQLMAPRLEEGSQGPEDDFTFDIQLEEAACLSLTGHHSKSLALLDGLKAGCRDEVGSMLRILELRMQTLTLAGQLLETLPDAAEGLSMLGAPLPLLDQDIESAIPGEHAALEAALARVGLSDIQTLPLMTDEKTLAMVRLMDRTIMAGYCSGRVRLVHLLVLRMLALVLRHGVSPLACLALPLYSQFFLIRLHRYEEGHALSQIGMAVMDRFHDQTRRGQFNVAMATSVVHWKGTLQECIALMDDGATHCLDCGDHVYAAFNLSFARLFEFHLGMPLPALTTHIAQAVATLHRIKEKHQQGLTMALRHVTSVLSGDSPLEFESGQVKDGVWEDAAFLEENVDNHLNLAAYHVVKAATLCHLQDYHGVLAVVSAVAPIRAVLQPVFFSVLLDYYEALAYLQLLQAQPCTSPRDPSGGPPFWTRRMQECVTALQEYGEVNPPLHQHRYWLVHAEHQRWMGDHPAAEAAYEKAIEGAGEGSFLQDVALAHFLASRHYTAIGRQTTATWHLSEAHDAYTLWGAAAIVQRLPVVAPKQRPGQWRAEAGPVRVSASVATDAVARARASVTRTPSASSALDDSLYSLDMRAVLAASQTLSSEMVRDALLEKLLSIVREVAGARYVALLLQHTNEGRWYLEGTASVAGRPGGPRGGEGAESHDGVVTRVAPVELGCAADAVPQAVVLYVSRTQEVVLLQEGVKDAAVKDPYLDTHCPQSVLCMPIVRHGEVGGVLYVEHELLPHAFPPDRIQTLALLSAQIAISIENSTMVAEMRNRETELVAAKNLAEEATRSKSLFLATMSHEIRTPLNAIIGMTSLLLGTSLTREHQECVETIRQSGDQLLALISDILDFSKIEARTLELESAPFSVAQCLEEAADLVAANAAAKHLELATHTPADVPTTVLGDISRLRQVLVNLLSNAVKFTEGGEVILRATCIETGEDAVTLEFTCRDTGIGIAEEHIPRLFAAFSQADASTTRKFGGTGLGLAISSTLVRAMGGQIDVDSAPGAGSTFRFRLQLEPAPGEANTGMGMEMEGGPAAGRTCLLVVRNASVRGILEEQLTAGGVRCSAVATEKDAMGAMQQGGAHFDFGLADLSSLNGATLADSALIKAAPKLPLVILSTWTEREEKAQECASVIISKPVRVGSLWDAVAKVLSLEATANGAATEDHPGGTPSHCLSPSTSERMARLRPLLKILIAEDNVVNQRVATLLLKRLGYTADCVANGQECIRALEGRAYHVVLMDLQMPVLDGLQASRAICATWSKEERPHLVAVTANAMQGDRDICLAAGMDEYISKPVRIEELKKVLDARACKLENGRWS